MRSSKSGTIVISDLALNNNNLEDVKSIEDSNQSKRKGWNLVWLDHHCWQGEIRRRHIILCYSYLIGRSEGKLCF